MKCLHCEKADTVVGVVVLTLYPRLVKGGSVDPTTLNRITQSTVKEAWEADLRAVDGTTETYHPVQCKECGGEMYYVRGKGLQIEHPDGSFTLAEAQEAVDEMPTVDETPPEPPKRKLLMRRKVG